MGATIIVSDRMQQRYIYRLSAPQGKQFSVQFSPVLTPKEVLRLGVFGGKYMSDCADEFPSDWFDGVQFCHERHDPQLNYFKVNASQPLSVWRKNGWIHPDDPRGWFQWYCRYFLGRRHEDDDRQIGRWRAMTRHIAQVKRNCTPGDYLCRPRQRQALLHWAYDSRKF